MNNVYVEVHSSIAISKLKKCDCLETLNDHLGTPLV